VRGLRADARIPVSLVNGETGVKGLERLLPPGEHFYWGLVKMEMGAISPIVLNGKLRVDGVLVLTRVDVRHRTYVRTDQRMSPPMSVSIRDHLSSDDPRPEKSFDLSFQTTNVSHARKRR